MIFDGTFLRKLVFLERNKPGMVAGINKDRREVVVRVLGEGQRVMSWDDFEEKDGAISQRPQREPE